MSDAADPGGQSIDLCINALWRRRLDAAADTPLKELAESPRRDISDIQAAVDFPVEGQINRLKMLKRIMYGRAGFQLLRACVLHAA